MKHLRHEEIDGISILTVDREERLNALGTSLLKEMLHFLEVTAVELQVKVLILTGAGEKAFIAGADIKEMEAMNKRQASEFLVLGNRVADTLENAPFVTIAAINGYALGGGLEMALACDFIFGAEEATVGLPEVTLGLIPGFGGTQRLADAIGKRRASEMILTGRKVKAKEAFQLGILNRICPRDLLLDVCLMSAKKIISHKNGALLAAKRAIGKGFEVEQKEFLHCFESANFRLGKKESCKSCD